MAGRGTVRPEERHLPPSGQAPNTTVRPKDQRTASACFYGAISPAEDKGAALALPRCDTECMTLYLAEISAAVAPGANAGPILDQAGWHSSTGLVIPANITLLTLPAKCPELNRIAIVWQFMRDDWLWRLHDQHFQGYGPLFRRVAGRIKALLDDKGYDADVIHAEIAGEGCKCAFTRQLPQTVPCALELWSPLVHDDQPGSSPRYKPSPDIFSSSYRRGYVIGRFERGSLSRTPSLPRSTWIVSDV